MNETRKAIIELIGDYMEKDLVKGCLFTYAEEFQDEILFMCALYDDTGDTKTLSYLSPLGGIYEINNFTDETDIKILGHYDISVVLRKIHNSKNCFGIKMVQGNTKFIEIDRNDGTSIIPNKPLHLYTEQEEKDLLELLTKLGKTM